MHRWRKLFHITLQEWESGLQSDFFYMIGDTVVSTLLEMEEGGLDPEVVKEISEVDDILVFSKGDNS